MSNRQERPVVAVVSVTSSPSVPLLPLHNESLSLVRAGELIALGWVQYIDCEDKILLASECVLCWGDKNILKSNLLLRILVHGEGTMEGSGYSADSPRLLGCFRTHRHLLV